MPDLAQGDIEQQEDRVSEEEGNDAGAEGRRQGRRQEDVAE